MSDDREPLGRIAHATYRDWLAEQARRVYGDEVQLSSWEDLTGEMREAYMRIGSAVAARAVEDAKLRNDRLEAQVFALGANAPAIRRALVKAIADAEYEAEKKDYRAALKVLGGGEDQERSEEKGDHE